MRKKFFSTLMLGAALVVSASLSSCKDYDDDINDLRTDLTSLQTQLAALQSDYDTQKAAFQTSIAAAQEAANKAQSTADQAVKDAANAQALANAAQAAADKAQATADANAKTLGEQLQLINGKVDKTEFNDSVRSFVGKIAAINENLLTLAKQDEVLNNAILANKAAIEDLNGQVATLNNFKEQIDALNLTTTYPTLLTDVETAKQNIIDIRADVQKKYDELKAEADEALATAKTANETANTANATANKNAGLIADLTIRVSDNESAIADLKTRMGKAEDAINALDSKINQRINEAKKELNARIDSTNENVALNLASINTLNIYVTNSITSLVYNPDAWVFGFGAIPVFTFDGLAVYNVDTTKVSTTGETVTKDEKATEGVSPTAVARYWMNPSSAKYDDYKYSFEELATTNQYTTRGHADAQKCNPTIDQSKITEEGGVLTVPFTIKNPENVNNLTSENTAAYKAWVTTIALRAHKTQNLTGTEKDADVVSDYAVLDPTYSHELRLANTDFKKDSCETPENGVRLYELETVPSEAIASLKANEVSYTLAYNATEPLDLKSKIEIHYNEDGVAAERTMTVKEAEALGLTFNFRPAKYALTEGGADETAASQLNITKDGVVSVSGKPQAIGHTAMVAVELKKDGKNVAVGYITVKVATTGNFDFSEVYDNLYLNNCTVDSAKLLLTSTVWNQAAENTGLTVDELKKAYTLDATQYVADKDTFVVAEGDKKYGTIAIQNADPEKDEVVWSFTKAEIQNLFYPNGVFDASKLKDVKTVIRLTPNDENHTAIYVTLTIGSVTAPSAQVTIGPANGLHQNGIKQYWYADGSTVAGSGWDEIHVNVAQPGNAGATDDKEFKSNLLTTFVGNQARATITDSNFKGLSDVLKIYFNVAKYESEKPTFVGTSGTKYNLTANKDTVFALAVTAAAGEKPVPVVVLSDGNANERFVEFQNNDIAKDILNKYAHRDAADTEKTEAFETYMIMLDPADPNCFPLALTGNNTFNVRYLRPIDVVSSDADKFEDATEKGYSELNIADLFKFNDWRDIEFGKTGHFDWLQFYGVKALTPDLSKVETDLNGTREPLKNVTSLLQLTTVPSPLVQTADYSSWNAFVTSMGKIRYQNLGATVGDFNLWIPFTVEHNWGKIENVWIHVAVSKSKNNAK